MSRHIPDDVRRRIIRAFESNKNEDGSMDLPITTLAQGAGVSPAFFRRVVTEAGLLKVRPRHKMA